MHEHNVHGFSQEQTVLLIYTMIDMDLCSLQTAAANVGTISPPINGSTPATVPGMYALSQVWHLTDLRPLAFTINDSSHLIESCKCQYASNAGISSHNAHLRSSGSPQWTKTITHLLAHKIGICMHSEPEAYLADAGLGGALRKYMCLSGHTLQAF